VNEWRQRNAKASQLGPTGPSNMQGMAPLGQPRRMQQQMQPQTPQQQSQTPQQQQQLHLQQQQQQRIKRSSSSPREEVLFGSLY